MREWLVVGVEQIGRNDMRRRLRRTAIEIDVEADEPSGNSVAPLSVR